MKTNNGRNTVTVAARERHFGQDLVVASAFAAGGVALTVLITLAGVIAAG